MSRKSYPNVNAANQYARNVVRGKIVACQFVIQACQRHLDDLMAEKSKSFRYRFDKDLAERAAKFIQLLPHTNCRCNQLRWCPARADRLLKCRRGR